MPHDRIVTCGSITQYEQENQESFNWRTRQSAQIYSTQRRRQTADSSGSTASADRLSSSKNPARPPEASPQAIHPEDSGHIATPLSLRDFLHEHRAGETPQWS